MTLATSHFDLCDDVGGRTGVIDDDDLGGDLDDASLCRRRPSSRSALLPFHQHRHKYMPNRAIRLLRAFGDHRSSWSFMAIAPMFFAQRLPSMAAAAAATRTSIPGGRAPPRPTINSRWTSASATDDLLPNNREPYLFSIYGTGRSRL